MHKGFSGENGHNLRRERRGEVDFGGFDEIGIFADADLFVSGRQGVGAGQYFVAKGNGMRHEGGRLPEHGTKGRIADEEFSGIGCFEN